MGSSGADIRLMKATLTISIMAGYLAIAALLAMSCATADTGGEETQIPPAANEYRQDMRLLVQNISSYAKGVSPGFIVIPQNGHELLTIGGEKDGRPALAYLDAIDGVGREDLVYGYDDDDAATPVSERNRMTAFMDIAEHNGVRVLVTDYCWTRLFVDDSYARNAERGYISFAADHRELDNVPSYPPAPFNVNATDIATLADARNFLYLLDSGAFPGRTAFLDTVRDTSYDVLIIDAFYEYSLLTGDDVLSLKTKANGGKRLVLAYMSIGEAEDYRYYWQEAWAESPPAWLAGENPDWPGNYKVRYWDSTWQAVIFGNGTSYLGRILEAGFDGVYLDIIDAYEFFEDE